MLIYWPDRYNIQKRRDEAVDDFLWALKFIPDWFVTRKMFEKFHDALNANEDLLFFDEGFNKAYFGTKNYTWRLDLVEKSSWFFVGFFVWLFRPNCANTL